MEEHHAQAKKDAGNKSILENIHTVHSDDKIMAEPKDHPKLDHAESKQKSSEDNTKQQQESDTGKLHQKSNSRHDVKPDEQVPHVPEKDHSKREVLVNTPTNLHQKSNEIDPIIKTTKGHNQGEIQEENSNPDLGQKTNLQHQEEEIAREFQEDNEETSRGDSVIKAHDRAKHKKGRDEDENELDQINSTDLLEKQSMSLNQIKKAVAKGHASRKLSQGAHQKPQFSMTGLILARMTEYDGLRDQNLQPFFVSQYRRRVLIKNGLITEDGYIIRHPEEYLKKKEIYIKTNCYPEEASNVRAQTLDKKKFNPYKENAMKKTKPIHFKSKRVAVPKQTLLSKQDTNKKAC